MPTIARVTSYELLVTIMPKIRRIFFYFSLLFQLALLYFSLLHWHNNLLGWFLFIVYLFLTGSWWQIIFRNIFGMKRHDWITKLFAWFIVFLLLSFVSSIWVVWYKITPLITWTVYITVVLLSLFVYFLSQRNKNRYSAKIYIEYGEKTKFKFFKKNIFYIFAFLILWFVGLLLLTKVQSIEILNSPWQAINQYYLPVFFALSALLGIMVFSRHKVKLILIFIIMHSILLHFYLPASHVMPWGGDVWRHIGIEQKLLDGEFHPPVLAGEEAKWREVLNIDLPEALVIPNKYFYGQLWGSSVLLAHTLKSDLLAINKWLMPILWSIILPLIFFRMGRILFGSWRKGLLFAVLPSIAFPFQALGGLTLPVSLGYLTFFFVMMFWLQYLRDEEVPQKWIAILLSMLMLFGYTLHFIIIWLVILLGFIIKLYKREEVKLISSGNNKTWLSYIFAIGLSVISLLTLPFIEVLAGISRVPNSWNWFVQAKQLVGQFSGGFYASKIRPHDILSGNIFFNHTPDWAFVSNLFTDWRWHVLGLMIIVWAVVFYGLWRSRKEKLRVQWFVLWILFVMTLGGYIIGWFVMEGDRSFVRRLDAMVVFLLLIFLIGGFYSFLRRVVPKFLARPVILISIILFSWLGTTTYASGPDMRVISQNEYEVANYLLEVEYLGEDNHCILADTWILLVLEGLSGQKIVGGGFPIDYQFAQTERVRFLREMEQNPRQDILQEMHELTSSIQCSIVLPKKLLVAEKEDIIKDFMNSEGKSIGEFVVWQEQLFEIEIHDEDGLEI